VGNYWKPIDTLTSDSDSVYATVASPICLIEEPALPSSARLLDSSLCRRLRRSRWILNRNVRHTWHRRILDRQIVRIRIR